MKSIKRQLKTEINGQLRYDFDSLKEKCQIPDSYAPRTLVTANGELKQSKKSLYFIIIGLLLAIAVCCVAIIIAGNKDDSFTKPSEKNQYFIIDINPSFEIEYNSQEQVVCARPYNEDAEILLATLSLESIPYEDAFDLVFDKCIELGYISSKRTDNAILISAVDENGERVEEMTEKAKDTLSSKFKDKKILGVVITGVANSELQEEADAHGVDVQKYAYIKSYIELGGELEDDKYDDVSIREIRTMIYEKEKELKKAEIDNLQGSFTEQESLINELLPEIIRVISAQVEARIAMLGDCEASQKYTALLRELQIPQGDATLYEYCIGVASALIEIRAVEYDVGIIATLSYYALSHTDVIEDILKMKELNKPIEEKIKDRQDSVGEIVDGDAVDVDKWQSENENDFVQNWFENKSNWEAEVILPMRGKDSEKQNENEPSSSDPFDSEQSSNNQPSQESPSTELPDDNFYNDSDDFDRHGHGHRRIFDN